MGTTKGITFDLRIVSKTPEVKSSKKNPVIERRFYTVVRGTPRESNSGRGKSITQKDSTIPRILGPVAVS